MNRDDLAAYSATQATTPRERVEQNERIAQRVAEQGLSAAAARAKQAQREADAIARAGVDRLRASYTAEHPTATEADFERDLPSLIAGSREETLGDPP